MLDVTTLERDLLDLREEDLRPDEGGGRVFVIPSEPGGDWSEIARSRSAEGAAFDPWAEPLRKTALQKAEYTGGEADVISLLGGADIQTPLFDPAYLWDVFRRSAHLRPVVEAYANGIETPHQIRPIIDLTDDDAELEELVRGALAYERIAPLLDENPHAEYEYEEPTDAEVRQAVEQLRREARMEWFRLTHILGAFSPESSFLDLRRLKRLDQEVTGAGYWEIRRVGGAPRYGFWAPAVTIREGRMSPQLATATTWERVTPFTLQARTRQKRFRRFVQRVNGTTRWFKEFGDPREMDARTGRYVGSGEADYIPATELLQWDLADPVSPSGCPRWSGIILDLLGAMAASRVNLDYFHAKPPAGILLVNGTRLSSRMMNRIKSEWQASARGEERFHGLVVIEAVSPQGLPSQASGKVSIEFVPLTDTQQGDALFQTFDRNVADKAGATFRLPGIARGRIDDANRANAEAGMESSERTLSEERNSFDERMNGTILPAMGIRLWRFQSSAPDPKDYDAARVIVTALEKTTVMTRNEGRRDLGEALNIDLPALSEEEGARLASEEAPGSDAEGE